MKQLKDRLRLVTDLYQKELHLRMEYERRNSARTTQLLQAELSMFSLRDALDSARQSGANTFSHSVEVSIQTTDDTERCTTSRSHQTFHVSLITFLCM